MPALGMICALSKGAWATTISGPTITGTGSYTLSWSTGGDEIELQERPQGGTFTTVYQGYNSSRSFTKSSDSVWEYRARACIPPEPGFSGYCMAWGSIHQVTVEFPPTTPGSLGPSFENTTGSYTLSWGASQGANIDYKLYERPQGGLFSRIATTSATSRSLSGKADGSYDYRVRACNQGGCSSYTSITTATVLKRPTVPTNLGLPASSTVAAAAPTALPWPSMCSRCRAHPRRRACPP